MSHDHESTKNIKVAFFLNLSFTILELVGGILTNSLAILSDAVHDLGDTFALGAAWYLDKVSKKPRTQNFSYGLGRFSLLSALISSLVLLFGSLYILSEAVPRLLKPEHSNAPGMIGFAILGIIVNGFAVLRLKKGQSMNEKVVFWHLFEDVLGWFAVLITGIIIYIKDIHILDPILSILLVIYVLWNVLRNLKKTVMLFLQGVPEGISMEAIEEEIKSLEHVKAIHDTHIWTLDGQNNILTTHIVIDKNMSEKDIINIKCRAKELLHKLNINHATIEMEKENEECVLDNH